MFNNLSRPKTDLFRSKIRLKVYIYITDYVGSTKFIYSEFLNTNEQFKLLCWLVCSSWWKEEVLGGIIQL